MQKKIKKWIKRYLPAEIIGTISAIIFASSVYTITRNELYTAFAGTWGENLGFYGIIIFRDINSSKKTHKAKNKRYTFLSILANIRSIIFEFGPAELIDSIFIRPLMMYIFPNLLKNIQLGILIGKIVADIIFYIPAIISYESQQLYKNKNRS